MAEVRLLATTEKIRNLREAKKFCQDAARMCYSEKDPDEIRAEEYNANLVDNVLINNRHQSPFDHFNLTFYFGGFPKAFAMLMNNQRPYTTSEKSARYTQMSSVVPEQKQLYNKWMKIFMEKIKQVYPEKDFPKLYSQKGNQPALYEKLAQENARYMTSVFTPTRMWHTISLAQMNIIAGNMEDFVNANSSDTQDPFRRRLGESIQEFLDSEVVKQWRIPDLKDKTGRGLIFFGKRVEEYFGEDIYSTNNLISFACLAQAHRHRILRYHIVQGEQLGAPYAFFVPPLVQEEGMDTSWIRDLESVAQTDFPQAQRVLVAERGMREDLFAKTRERICGLAQLEIARKTGELLDNYAKEFPEVAEWRKPACVLSGEGCRKGGCVFGAGKALERLI